MGFSSFIPILSAIGTPTYSLSKFLVPLLSQLTVSEILKQNCHCHITSFDVNSLFTNIPLDQTINIMNNIETASDGTVCGIKRT